MLRRLLRVLAALARGTRCRRCGRRVRGLAESPEIPVHMGTGMRSCTARFEYDFSPAAVRGPLADW